MSQTSSSNQYAAQSDSNNKRYAGQSDKYAQSSDTSFVQQVTTRFNKFSTTQKVVGGALLALAVYLVRRNGDDSSDTSTDSSSDNPYKVTSGQTKTLHELLHFVNDRIEGYQHAVAESQDTQLRGYYKQLVSQSQRFSNELNAYLRKQGGGRETDTTVKGNLYRGWMDVKAAIVDRDEKAILGSNLYGEEWALKAYKDALDDQTLKGAIRLAVEHQYELSQQTYKRLQKLQDKQE